MSRRSPPAPPSLRRRASIRKPKVALLIFCEGKNTEPSYLEAFAQEHGNQLVRIQVVAPAGVPLTIIAKAKAARAQIAKSKNSFEIFDQVWALFDRDEHPGVEQAIADAKAGQIQVGYSNPCFEVWLLLHHSEFDAPDDRHAVQKRYAAVDDRYDPKRSKTLDYETLRPGYTDACARAVRMRGRRQTEGRPLAEPYTDVDVLTELIVANGRTGRTN
jgi:hypothetical protein